MQNNVYPKFEKHSNATCFHCSASIGHETPINYGFPKGKYGIWCENCKLRTYYDTDDNTLKFDRKGDVLKPVCSCGCTTPYNEWIENESGYKECPDCKMV